MAYYYRGILYWMDGEPDNARACFRSAAIQDAATENHQYAADYVLLDYLDGLVTARLAGDGSDAFARAQGIPVSAKPPPYNEKANVFFFIESGSGPRKYASGQYRQELRFTVTLRWRPLPRFSVEDQSVAAAPYDDLYFQATTRGGRVMDHVLENKAVFKSATDTAGNVAILGGAVAALQHNQTSRRWVSGSIAAGIVSKIVSATTTPPRISGPGIICRVT